MNLQLPSDLSDSLRLLVNQGRFRSEQEACVAGLELLIAREKLKAAVDRGREQLASGHWSDEETVFAEAEAEIERAEAEHTNGA